MGMIGGGAGSFIGPVHRIAARLDGLVDLVSGAFSSDPALSLETGLREGLDRSRIYGSWQEMLLNESKLPESLRPHFIAIVTPNYLHYRQARMALESGFSVLCDKPLCMTSSEAAELRDIVIRENKLFCLTHNYTGYPMIKKAREMVLSGELGEIRKLTVEYFQGWLSSPLEKKGNKQAAWRTDPSMAGIGGAMADIGTHAFNLAEYVTGLEARSLTAELNTILPGRKLDDDGSVILHFENGACATLLISQVAIGEENNLSIRVYGTRGSLKWQQMEPNTLTVMWPDKPVQLYRTAAAYSVPGPADALHTRLPAGHPEGFIEAFANLYRNFALHLSAMEEHREPDPYKDYPGIKEGLRGILFLEAAVAASNEKVSRKLI